MLILNPVRTAARLTLISYHTAHSYRAVQFLMPERHLLTGRKCKIAKVNLNLQKRACVCLYLRQTGVIYGETVKILKSLVCMLYKRHKQAGKELLIGVGVIFQAVNSYVVNVLYEDDILCAVIKVLYKRTVASRAEE